MRPFTLTTSFPATSTLLIAGYKDQSVAFPPPPPPIEKYELLAVGNVSVFGEN
jgi:hypothetical protein